MEKWQGAALNDTLVADDLSAGRLTVISTVGLTDHGDHLVLMRKVGLRGFVWVNFHYESTK